MSGLFGLGRNKNKGENEVESATGVTPVTPVRLDPTLLATQSMIPEIHSEFAACCRIW